MIEWLFLLDRVDYNVFIFIRNAVECIWLRKANRFNDTASNRYGIIPPF